MASSATGGYLRPALAPNDKAVRQYFHDMVVGLTGLNGKLVRPRWQANPGKQPDHNEDWCAFGWQTVKSDANAYVQINDHGDGGILRRDEYIELLATFYGPNCEGYATMLRDGLEIDQNRDVLRESGIAYNTCDGIVHLPELINDIWYDRQDVTLNFTRQVERNYNILSFVAAEGIIVTDLISRLQRTFHVDSPPTDDNYNILLGDGGVLEVNAQGDLLTYIGTSPAIEDNYHLFLGDGGVLKVNNAGDLLFIASVAPVLLVGADTNLVVNSQNDNLKI